jgi:5-methylcytosine-specific restriction endonuclease McrA
VAWETSDRRARLPDDWNQRVAAVKKRDQNRCTWRLPSGLRCPRPGRDVDHRVNDDNHELSNLRLLCKTHHDRKTQREAWAGRTRPKAKKRPTERQPGSLR